MKSTLAKLIVVTDGEGTAGRPLVEVVAAAIEGGARAVLLREKHLSRNQRLTLAEELRTALAPVGGTLLAASDPTIAVDGVHLAAADAFPPEGPAGLVGRSCHSFTDLEAAAAEGCDYATLSPIFLTASKPGYGPPLGTPSLAHSPLPTWALGGVDVDHARSCLQAGAAGVAVMGAIMRAGDPAAVAAAFLRALS